MLFDNPEPWLWVTLVVVLALLVGAWRNPPKPEPPRMVDDAKKDPLASLRPDPGMMQSGGEVPEPVRMALMEIVAEAVRTNSLHRHWNLEGLQAAGFPLGSYRITIEKTA